MTLEQLYAETALTDLYIAFAIMAALFLFIAFFGFRFIKIEIILSAAVTGYDLGSGVLATAIGDKIQGFDAGIVLGIACAVVFGLIAIGLYKFYIRFIGGMLGAVIGYMLSVAILSSLVNEIVSYIVGIVFAIVFAIIVSKLFFKAFKAIFIISSSVVGMTLASACISLIAFSENEVALGAAMLVGLVLSIPAAIAQFRMNRGRNF